MPITRLSKANIRRASKAIKGRYAHLSARRKAKVRFKTAWKIQKARVKKYGHR